MTIKAFGHVNYVKKESAYLAIGKIIHVLMNLHFYRFCLVFRKKDLYLVITQKLIILKSGRFHVDFTKSIGFHVDFMKSSGFHVDFMQIS